jgi:hypothetical protein
MIVENGVAAAAKKNGISTEDHQPIAAFIVCKTGKGPRPRPGAAQQAPMATPKLPKSIENLPLIGSAEDQRDTSTPVPCSGMRI